MQSPPFSVSPEVGRTQSAEGSSPSRCLCCCLRQQNRRAHKKRPFAPKDKQTEGFATQSQNMDLEWPREEEREETCCWSRYTDVGLREWAAAGIQTPTQGGKEQQMHPKEQNDGVNCFDFSFLPIPLLRMQRSPQTSANALKFGERCGTQALFDPCTHNNQSETLEIDRPVTEHWDLPQMAANEEIFACYDIST